MIFFVSVALTGLSVSFSRGYELLNASFPTRSFSIRDICPAGPAGCSGSRVSFHVITLNSLLLFLLPSLKEYNNFPFPSYCDGQPVHAPRSEDAIYKQRFSFDLDSIAVKKANRRITKLREYGPAIRFGGVTCWFLFSILVLRLSHKFRQANMVGPLRSSECTTHSAMSNYTRSSRLSILGGLLVIPPLKFGPASALLFQSHSIRFPV